MTTHESFKSAHQRGQSSRKSPTAGAPYIDILRISLCLFAGALLTGVGCVSQQTYDTTKAKTSELTRTLDRTRTDVKELEQHIAALHAANRQEDAVTAELHAVIQREHDMLPILRQRADDELAALQTQVAHLVNQRRLLARKMADAKQEGASLQAMVTQYKQDIEESRSRSTQLAMAANTPASAQLTQTPVVTSVAPTSPVASPQQTTQVNPNTPLKKSTPARSPKSVPAEADESWADWLMNWVLSLWGWIFN
jgi:peptidoglycan hydrolase CwlO-like protein